MGLEGNVYWERPKEVCWLSAEMSVLMEAAVSLFFMLIGKEKWIYGEVGKN